MPAYILNQSVGVWWRRWEMLLLLRDRTAAIVLSPTIYHLHTVQRASEDRAGLPEQFFKK